MASKLHQGHPTGSRDIQNGWILSGQPSYIYINAHSEYVTLTAFPGQQWLRSSVLRYAYIACLVSVFFTVTLSVTNFTL